MDVVTVFRAVLVLVMPVIECVQTVLHLLMEQKSAAACRPCGSLETQASGMRRPTADASSPTPCRPAILPRLVLTQLLARVPETVIESRSKCNAVAYWCGLKR